MQKPTELKTGLCRITLCVQVIAIVHTYLVRKLYVGTSILIMYRMVLINELGPNSQNSPFIPSMYCITCLFLIVDKQVLWRQVEVQHSYIDQACRFAHYMGT